MTMAIPAMKFRPILTYRITSLSKVLYYLASQTQRVMIFQGRLLMVKL